MIFITLQIAHDSNVLLSISEIKFIKTEIVTSYKDRTTATGRDVKTPMHQLVITCELKSGEKFVSQFSSADKGFVNKQLSNFLSQLKNVA